jgi:hypothetical protein
VGRECETHRLVRTLELARRKINQQRPDMALELLFGIQTEIEGLEGTALEAECRLVRAEAHAAMRDQAARAYFGEALELLGRLPEPSLDLQLRAYEHYGDFLLMCHRRSDALRQYQKAGEIATGRVWSEDTARIQLKLVGIGLEMDSDPQLGNFRLLRHEADLLGCTSQQQLAGWHLHLGKLEDASRGMRFARSGGPASEQYFVDLLKSVKDPPK